VPFTPPRQSPVQYAEGLGVLHGALVAAHCVQSDAGDLETLARRRVAVALCPRSNEHLGVGLPPLEAMRASGMRLCLGTDSLASAPSLDLMDDVRTLRRAFPRVPPSVLLRMATAGGAEALGLADLGTIAPGKQAALAYAHADRVPRDPEDHLVNETVPVTRAAA